MKGLELANKYYLECGKPQIEKDFFEIKDKLAFGLVGSGSECYGYDDEISMDHDYEPGFCIFVPDELDSKTLFKLERMYAKLPNEFEELKRNIIQDENRHGVIKISDFYKSKIGNLDYENNGLDWFNIPEHYLSEATNGQVFEDNLGLFSHIRNKIKYYPEDIRLKKLAGALIMMKQSGEYNYSRCISRNDTAAAQLALFEYVKYATSAIFLLNKIYMPYYKWQFKALKNLPLLSNLSDVLEYLISTENTKEFVEYKKGIIDDINHIILTEVKNQGLSKATCFNLETNAFSVNDSIKDNNIRTIDILYGV